MKTDYIKLTHEVAENADEVGTFTTISDQCLIEYAEAIVKDYTSNMKHLPEMDYAEIDGGACVELDKGLDLSYYAESFLDSDGKVHTFRIEKV